MGEVQTQAAVYNTSKRAISHVFLQRDAVCAALGTYFPLPLSLLNGFLKP